MEVQVSTGHSGNVHVVFSRAISYSFPSAQLWVCSSHNPTSKLFGKFFPTNKYFFAVQRVIFGKLDDKWLSINLATIMDKSLGTLLRFWGVFQFTRVQPFPSPHKQCSTRVSRIFSEFQLCIGWGRENCKKISKRMHCFKREPRNDRKI